MNLPIKIIRNNKIYWVFTLVIFFSISFLGILENVSKSMSEDIYNEQKNIYGIFSFVAYIDGSNLKDGSFGARYVNEIFPDKNVGTPGYIYKLGYADVEGFTVDFGYLDDAAWYLSAAKLLKGKLPQKNGEIALSDTKVSELSSVANCDVGDQIDVNGKSFVISGIYEDFGTRWIGSNSFRSFSEVDAVFSKEETERIWNNNHSHLLTVLMEGDELFSNEEIQNAKNIFCNIYISEEYAKNMYQLPSFVIPAILLTTLLLIGSVLLLIDKQRTPVHAIYLQLGFSKSHLFVIECISLFLCYVLGLIAGIVCICGVTAFLLRLQSISFAPHTIFFNWGAVLLIAIYLITIVILYSSIKDKRRFPRKGSVKQFAAGTFILSKYLCLFIFLYTLVLMWEYNITSAYRYKYEKENLPDNAGEMDHIQEMEYDFELLSTDTASPDDFLITDRFPEDESGIYFYNNYMYFGISKENIERFNSLDGVLYTKPYKENDTVLLYINGNQINDYIDASDFFRDGAFTPRTLDYWNDYMLEHYELDGQFLVNAKLLGCEADDLEAMKQYLGEGDIDLDKLASGEEIILIAPSFSLKKLNEKQTLMSRLLPGSPKDDTYYTDSAFSAGDTVTFHVLQPKNTGLSFGTMSGSDIIKHFEAIECTARIGAVMHDYVGWFSHDKTAKPYILVTNNQAFDKWGLKSETTRLRIYADENKSEEDVTKLIYKTYRAIHSPMEIENKMRSERVHKRYLYFLKTIRNIFTLLSAVAFFAVLVLHIILQILSHKRTIGLLFLNGLSLSQLFINFMKAFSKIWWASMAVFLISLHLIVPNDLKVFISFADILTSGMLVFLVQIFTLLPCCLVIKKNSVVQLLTQ